MYELNPNTTLQSGKYRIQKVLGQGTFGITYLATMKVNGSGCDMEVDVAIKEFFMKEQNTRSDENSSVTGSQSELFRQYREKFKTEAKNLAKMSDFDDIQTIYDVFEENNTAYFAMEYIDGINLNEYIKQNGRLSESEAVDISRSIAKALKHLHNNNMLHLDLKPKNVMRRNDGKIYLIDFGLSKQYDEKGEPESSSTIGLGTPGYAPLEQANFKGGFAPTLDIYALGATLYKMLTGETPPESSDIFNDGFESLLQKMRSFSISEKTIAVVEKAMQVRKSNRYQSVDEFLAALGEANIVSDNVEEPDDSTTVQSRVEISTANSNEPQKSSNWKKIVFIIIGIIAGILAVWLIMKIKAAHDHEYAYLRACSKVEETIADLKNNTKPVETLLEEYETADDLLWVDIYDYEDEYKKFSSVYNRFEVLEDDLFDAYYDFRESYPPIIVKNIQFQNTTRSGIVIDDVGSTLYASKIQYLCVRLSVIDMRGSGDYTFSVKIYMDGVLSRNNSTSPSGYTYEIKKTLQNCGSVVEIDGRGWGNEDGDAYKNVDNVRWEIWYNDKKLAEQTIYLH